MRETGDHESRPGPPTPGEATPAETVAAADRAPGLRGAAERALRWSATPSGLLTLFAAGLGIRLVLARGGGFPFDMSSFAGWSQRLAEEGSWGFYPPPGEEFFVDYPPGYLYVLWLLGLLARVAGAGAPSVFLLKLPPIFADLALAWLVASLAVRLSPEGRRLPVRGIAAAAILLNPAVFFVSAVWGQVDSVLAVLVAAAFLLLGTGRASFVRDAGGMALLAAAFATKPQAAFVAPVVVLVLVWRHARALDAAGRSYGKTVRIAARFAALTGVGLVSGQLLLAPFRMWPVTALDFYAGAGSHYPHTSVFAFNLWGIVGFWRPDSGPDGVDFLGVPVLYVGIALFAIVASAVLIRAWRALEEGQHEGRVLVFGGVAVTLVAFATLTRIHERYLFLAVALSASLVAFRWLRWAFVALSAAYLVNVFYPYVYYLELVGRPAPSLGGLVGVFYGSDVGDVRLKVLSAATALLCFAIAWVGFSRLEHRAATAGPEPPAFGSPDAPPAAPTRPERWTMQLHPIGRRGAVLALGVFAVALFSRVAGLGHPPGMYFDEVYHARTGAEYLAGKEVYEWTHPPLGKLFIALGIRTFSGFEASAPARLPRGVAPQRIGTGPGAVAWTVPSEPFAEVHRGRVTGSCGLRSDDPPFVADLEPDAVAASGERTFVAGVGFEGPALMRFEGAREVWRVALPARARSVVALGSAAYVLGRDGTLVYVDEDGQTDGVAAGAAAVAASHKASAVWASFPELGQVASWDAAGERTAVVEVDGRPGSLAVPDGADRVLVADTSEERIEVVDVGAGRTTAPIDGGARLLASVPETGIVWAAAGRTVRAIEPRGSSVIGRVTLDAPARALLADPHAHRLVASTDEGLSCVDGRPAFAWRFGSAVAGALLVALVFLLALRLFGNLLVAALAALFVTVEGLAFTMSRIAMIDSYGVAFIAGAWLCALSVLYAWGRNPAGARSRAAAFAWLLAAGVVAGAAVAAKWPGVYVLVGIALLFLWDGQSRGPDSIWRLAGGFFPTAFVLAVAIGVLPAAIYVAGYLPYFSLGHSFGELVKLQQSMFGYHSNLTATHPFGSPWYGWPFGHRAVFLYLADAGSHRSEIWTAPNLVVFWGGLAAMVAAGVRSVRDRSAALAVVVLAALVQYLPWTVVGRVTFLYHYLTVVPFLGIALAWWLVEGRRGRPFARATAAAVAAGAAIFFCALLPIYEGWSVPVGYLQAVRRALPWVIP